jgi:hypothetical protein
MAYIGNTPGVSSQRLVTSFTATASQTTFTPTNGYVVGYIDVYYNGVKLIVGDDYTASNGVTVVLATPAAAGDSVELVAYKPSGLSDGYTKAEADARYEPIDSAYTKTESDARYAQEGANTDITSISGITGGVGTPDYVDFDTAATITPAVGRLGWDAAIGSLQMGMAGGNVSTYVGQTMHAYVTNAESVTINKGQAVYLYQAQGNRATVKLANNVSDATSAKTFGLAAENIGANQIGYVICQGVLNNVNTAAFNAGDTLYLGSTAGALTATKPVAPNHLVYIGVVERANAGAGQIYVRPQNGYELDEIHDVLITSVADGQALVYESATDLWKNKAIVNSVAGKTGVVTLTNSDVGLGNVENKSSATIRGELTSANVTTALGFTPFSAAGGTISGNTTLNGVLTTNAGMLIKKQNTTGEGGEFYIEKSDSSTLAGNLVVDLINNALRIFENGGTYRGVVLDVGTCAGGVGSVLLTSTNVSSYVSGDPTLNVTSSTSISAVASNHYVLTGGATTVTLPASPAAGAMVWITVANNRTDNVIARNGQNIQGLAENMTLNTTYAAVRLRYTDATRGWVFT